MSMKNLARVATADVDVEIDPRVGRVLLEEVALILGGDLGGIAVPRTPTARKVGAAETEHSVPATSGRWVSVREAALALGFGVVSFRRLIERHTRRDAAGGIEASVDGVRARKVGRTWRVLLSSAWTSPGAAPRRKPVVHQLRGSARRGGSE